METDGEERLPDGYPRGLEATLTLDDGSELTIRPIVPGDASELSRAIAEADPDTLYHRFFTAAPNLGSRQIHYLAEVDYERRLALVALGETGQGVGVARYEGLDDPGRAEVAVVVHPDWRRRGVATELVDRLEAPAKRKGIEELVAVYLPGNGAVAALLAGLGYGQPRIVDGTIHVVKRVGDPR